MTSRATVEFCGETYDVTPGQVLTMGRVADVIFDEVNPFLHRVFLRLEYEHGLWLLRNVGSTLSATVASSDGQLQAWLSPSGQLPLVFPIVAVWFTAGETTYELEITIQDAAFDPVKVERAENGELTIGTVSLTPKQRLVIVALAEDILKRGNRGAGAIPTSAVAAERLHWPVSTFNRQLDAVCSKLDAMGVRGLHGGPGKLASSRKGRLVEYALGTQIVTTEDLVLLDVAQPDDGDD